MSDVTRILQAVQSGDRMATDELLTVVYEELRLLAAQMLSRERPGQTLQATALVHEAYIRLVGADDAKWQGRRHFFGAAAEAMRRILVENARHKQSLKGGGGRHRVGLTDAAPHARGPVICPIELDEALTELAEKAPRPAELVKLRYFAGLTLQQAAEVLGVSMATASRDWVYAKACLQLALKGGRERQ